MYPVRFLRGLLASTLLGCFTLAHVAHAAGTPLTLREALERTRAAHPGLRAARHERAAALALEREANRRPAPLLGATYENFGGDLGSGLAEATLTIEQPFELGGERAARRALSSAHSAVAEADVAQSHLLAEAATVAAFAEAWEAQERAARLRDAVQGAGLAATAAAERFRSGAAPAHEEARARSNLALRRIELEREERRRETALERLVAQWRGRAADVDSLELPPVQDLMITPWDSLAAALTRQPAMRRAAAERRREEERLRLVRAQRTPDLILGAGARHLADVPGTGLVASVSIPFSAPGSGPAALEAAQSSRDAAAARADAEGVRLLAELRGEHDRLRASLASLRELEQQVLPAAEDAMRGLAAGFRAGRFTYVEVLEGQRGLLEARFLGIELTREVWTTQLALERWTAAAAGGEAR